MWPYFFEDVKLGIYVVFTTSLIIKLIYSCFESPALAFGHKISTAQPILLKSHHLYSQIANIWLLLIIIIII